jgi:poly(hydroxyalkanoate) depolymerase family esterase
MKSVRNVIATLTVSAALAVSAVVVSGSSPASAASLTQVTNFGSNPGNMQMYLYVPTTVAASPGIVVAMHPCGGSGPGFYQSSEFASLADRYGFIVIYPSATKSNGLGPCFDTWSDASKVRGGGTDPSSLLSMITYVEQQYHGDANRVFATGSSSGGMMTQHMLALYPDIFKAGAAFMGVPFGCFATASDYPIGSSVCTGGSKNLTPAQWGDLVRRANPGYTGPWPQVQLWHGTNDTVVPYQLLNEAVEQWTNVEGLSQTATSTDTPVSGWTRRHFANSSGTDLIQAISVAGAGHSLPSSGMAAYAISWFGLDRAVSTTTTTTTTTTRPTTTTTTTTSRTSSTTSSTTSSSTSTTSSSTSTTTTTTTSAGTGGCTATFDPPINAWNTGFVANVKVSSTTAINSWRVTVTLPAGATVVGSWNGTFSGNSGTVTVVPVASWNAPVSPGSPKSFGFQATGAPTGIGLACAAA